MLKRALVTLLVLSGLAGPVLASDAGKPPAEVLDELLRANADYAANLIAIPDYSVRRKQLVSGQQPPAIILGCSDSRVPPEIVFNRGLGDLFVARTAGNVADPVVLGTLEYGAEHLHARLLLVLGHESCGAVKATIAAAADTGGVRAPGHLAAIVAQVLPAVRSIDVRHRAEAAYVQACVEANVRTVIEDLLHRSVVLRELVERDELDIVGATYSLSTGLVTVIHGARDTQGLLSRFETETDRTAPKRDHAPPP